MAKKVYILSEEMRASHSGFYIEGTDIEMDYPDFYPLPMETEVIENGVPIALRILPNCGYLEKEQQIKNGYKDVYRYTDNDRKKLTFVHSRLELDDKKDKLYVDFIERAAWLKGNEAKKSRQTTRTIYMTYDEDAIIVAELNFEELVTRAKSKVLAMGYGELTEIYRLSVGGNFSPNSVSMNVMRKHLLAIAAQNPDFIVKGISTTRDRLVVLLNKGVEMGVLTFDIPGQVCFRSEAADEWVNIISLSDAQGAIGKFERFIDYLQTDMGQAELSIIEGKVKAEEEKRATVDVAPSNVPGEQLFSHDEDKQPKRKAAAKA